MSNEKSEKPKDIKTYYLRTQSTILKGEQSMPLNTLLSRTTFRNSSLSKSKNKSLSTTQKIFYNPFMTENKSTKTKKYITKKNNKNKNKFQNSFTNFGIIDLNKVSGSSHSSTRLSYKNNKNIIPDQSNEFSLYSTNTSHDIKKTLNKYLTNNNINKYDHYNNHNKYNIKDNAPFYDLIRNIDNIKYNDVNKNNETDNINDNINMHTYYNNNLNNTERENLNNIQKKNNHVYYYTYNCKETDNNTYEDIKEPKESLMSKTMDFLNKTNRDKYNMRNEYKYDSKENDINNLYFKNNFAANKSKDSKFYNTYGNFNDCYYSNYRNYKNQYNKSKSNTMNNEIKNIINSLNYSLYNTTRNKKTEYIGNKINNLNYLFRNRTNNFNSSSNNSKNKNICNTERYNSRDKNYHSKYFLKELFEQSLTDKYINDFNYFSPLKKTKKCTPFTNFDYFNEDEEKKNDYTPKNTFNVKIYDNKLEKMLKKIPRHTRTIYEFNYDKIKNKLISKNMLKKSQKLSYEEIDNIMPPTILINDE
jgi:hypothetical protein